MGDKSLQRLSDHVDVDRSDGDTQPGEVKVGKVSMIESGVVRPARDILGELSLVSRGEDVFKVTHMKLYHAVTETITLLINIIQSSPVQYLFCLYSS